VARQPDNWRLEMNTTARIVIGVLLVIFGGVALLSWLSNSNREESTETYLDVTELVFDLENASIEVSAGGDETVVDMSVSTGFLAPTVDLEQRDGVLRLVQDCPSIVFGWGCQSSFEITVPPGTVLTGGTSNGAITLMGLDGPVNIFTSNGAVAMSDVSSDVDVRTSNGAISGSDMTSDALEANTSNGSIDMDFADAPSDLRLDTSNGRVEVVLPADSPPFALSTSTSNGTVTTEIRTDPAASDTIEIETSNGDITVRYAE
jgi:hypothetical protein